MKNIISAGAIVLPSTVGRLNVPLVQRRFSRPLPYLVALLVIAAMVLVGPIAQPAGYHQFADQRPWLGMAHAADVLSNLGFALVGTFGILQLWRRKPPGLPMPERCGYALFFLALILTALGSGYYHLAPDNSRLVWDRLPIALACAGLLAGVWRQTGPACASLPIWFAVPAIASVGWWRWTDLQGIGDLMPYLLVQILPLMLIPILQWRGDASRQQRLAFGLALALYVLAKLCEVADHGIFATLLVVSGHTLKHLLAVLAAAIIARHYIPSQTA